MRGDKFKVTQFIKEFILKIEKELNNFPKKDIEIKNRIRTNCYDLLEICFEANTTEKIERKIELLQKAIAKIKTIDFLLDLSYERTLISNKTILKLGVRMDDIIKYISGWLKKIKESN